MMMIVGEDDTQRGWSFIVKVVVTECDEDGY